MLVSVLCINSIFTPQSVYRLHTYWALYYLRACFFETQKASLNSVRLLKAYIVWQETFSSLNMFTVDTAGCTLLLNFSFRVVFPKHPCEMLFTCSAALDLCSVYMLNIILDLFAFSPAILSLNCTLNTTEGQFIL